MSLGNLVINNGASTPVAKTFSPVQELPIAIFKDKTGGISIGMPAVTISTSAASAKRPSNKWNVRVSVPVLETAAGAGSGGYTPPAKVAYTLLADVNVVAPDRSTADQRADVLAFAYNALQTAMVKGVIKDLNPVS